MSREGRRLFALAAGLAGLLLVCGHKAVAGSGATGGTLTISPAIIDTVIGPEGALPSITVANGTKVRFRIRIYPALVDQMLDGGLTIRERPVELRAAARRFALAPEGLLLGAGGTATVKVRLLRPRPAGEAVGAAVVEAIPVVPAGRPLPYRLRLLGALLVPGPRAPAPRGRIQSLRVVQAGPHRLGFLIRVHNTGRVHAYPSALRLRVHDSSGRTVFSTAPRTGVIVPGYTRDIATQTLQRLPGRHYVAEATGNIGGASSRAVVTFTLAAPNRLQTS